MILRPVPLCLGLAFVALAATPPAASAAAVEDVATANASGKTVFLLVTDGPGPGLEAGRALVRQGLERVPTAAAVELDRRDPAQAASVARYRVAAAPVPLVLVIASNGVAAGGVRPGEGALERLVAAIPSPRKAEYLKHLSEQRVAFVALTRANMADRSALFESMSGAVRALEGKAGTVVIDLDDPAEQRFLVELKADRAATAPVTLVMNPKGQLLGRLPGVPTAEKLVEAAKKRAKVCTDPGCKDPGCKDCEK